MAKDLELIEKELKETEHELQRLEEEVHLNFAGRAAKIFLHNPLTPIIAIFVLVLGIAAFIMTPKEENPQIDVPSASVIVAYPGASSADVQKVIVEPLSKKLNELTGVEHIFGMAQNGFGVVTVQFKVGENKETSLLKLYDRVMQNMDMLPKNASQPLVKPMDIDEVPIYSVALTSKELDEPSLFAAGREISDEIARIKNVSIVGVKPENKRQFNIWLDGAKLSAYNLSIFDVQKAISAASASLPAGKVEGAKLSVEVGFDGYLKNYEDLGEIIVSTRGGQLVYLKEIATIEDDKSVQNKQSAYVVKGQAFEGVGVGTKEKQLTLFVAKKRGSNAVVVGEEIAKKLEEIKQTLPKNIELIVTRNDGYKAGHVVTELMFHLAISIGIIVLLLYFMLGLKEAMIVSITIPLVFALTLFAGLLIDQTINRITLFALILSLGLLVDDAIVVIENIHRHFALGKEKNKAKLIIQATNEVGNPTFIATIAVVMAFIPMAFVTGMMGPYMGPIPFNVPVAMFSSLIIAFAFSPWLAYRFLKPHHEGEEFSFEDTKTYKFYDNYVRPMLQVRRKRYMFMFGVIALFVLSLSLPAIGLVKAKMLPASNVNTFNITVDLPTSSSLAETGKVAVCVENALKGEKDIKDFETFIGTTGIADFNGLLRGNSIKNGENVAEIRVNLRDKADRNLQSSEFVSYIRPKIKPCEAISGANIKLVEDPPGPPVLATLAFEIYGSDKASREILAEKIQNIMKHTEGVVDTDVLGDKPMMKYSLKPDFQKAAALGVSVEDISAVLMAGSEGVKPAVVLSKEDKNPVDIFVRLGKDQKQSIENILELKVPSRSSGELVSIKELVSVELITKDKAVTSKDLREATIVTGEMDGRGSVYAQFEIRNKLFEMEGFKAKWDGGPRFAVDLEEIATGKKYHIVMDGEWKVTFDTFRDLGSAFGVAVLMIYLLMVAYYKSFRVPGIVTSSIPLTLIGIMFGHAIMNLFMPTYFTATSMIGFIALAGIVVRNAIMLIDFTDELIKNGKTLENAILEAAATRFRPILLTALAIALASFVIVLDPVWNGLAVSLIFGVMIATILTLVVTPLMYWKHLKNNPRRIDGILNGRP